MSRQRSLKHTIVVFSILIGCVPLLLTGAYVVHLFSGTLKQEIEQRNLMAARSLAGEINRLLIDYRSFLEYCADQQVFKPGEPVQHMTNKLNDIKRLFPLFDGITLLDGKGKVVTSSSENVFLIGTDFSGHPFVREAFSKNRIVWSDVYLSSTKGSPTVSIALPYQNGLILADLNLDVLQDTTRKMNTGIGSYAVVLDRTGIIIAHPRKEFVEQRLNVRNLAFVQAGLRGEEGTFDYEFMGEEKIGSVVGIPETGWLSAIVQPRKEAFATVERMKSMLWTVTITVVILMMIVSAWMHQKMMVPLLHLEGIARRISEGEYAFEWLPQRFVEFDALSQAFQAMTQAISDREVHLQESRRAVEKSERQLRLLYNSVSDLVYSHDLEGKILSANKAMSDLLGYDPDTIVGEVITHAMKPEHHPLFHSDYLERFKEMPTQRGTFSCFDRFGNQRYVEYASTLVTDEDGRTYVTGIGRNVTERILSERALRRQDARMRAVLRAMPTPLAAYDTKGRLQFTNPAFTRVFGWTLEELSGKPVPFVPDSEKAITLAKIKELYATGKPGILETRRFTRDGRTVDVLISAALIQDAEGKTEGMVACFLDLTEKKRLEAELLQAQKMEAIGTLAGGIAHDFNNLLMVIQGHVSLMMLDLEADHPMMRRLEDISRNVNQGADLTRQLLGFAKGGKYDVRPIDFNRLIREHDAVFQRTQKGHVILEQLTEGVPSVMADRGQMEQILMNLYINAVQAMPSGGTITVATSRERVDPAKAAALNVRPGTYVCIRVSDTGIGMDEKTRQRIFEPFFTTKEKGRGTGLGLASVYGIVRNHGGFIEVESRPMHGTTFTVYLPATDERSAEDSKPSQRCNGFEKAKACGTLLLVDDEPMVREVGAQLLQHLGYEVIQAGGGKDALERYAAEGDRIDGVILDMIMPGMSGGVVFDQLKEMDPDVRVVLSSGYSIDGEAQAILDRGCRGFLQKPFSLHQLREVLDRVLSD
uniref:histidine kinase n=1 Tax=Desulfatirhabdium butyrativorans TaxID=340467 RepID=A0A7C4RHH9_9BACT